MKGPWPMEKQPGDLVCTTVGAGRMRVDRYGTVYINGSIIGKTYVSSLEDTREYLETITGGQ